MKTYSLAQLQRDLPEEVRARGLYLPVAGRSMGIRCVATKGTGKSRLFGRIVIWQDFLQGIPTIVIDPVGGLINEFLDKMCRLPRQQQYALWPRVRYVDMAGSETADMAQKRIVPFPLYTRESDDETHFQIANRFIEIIARINPELRGNPTVGMNAIREVGTRVGMLLAALNWQVTETEILLENAEQYRQEIEAVATTRELQRVARYVLDDLPRLRKKPVDWDMKTGAFKRKLDDFFLDPVLGATFGASTPGISWQQIVDGKQIVLFDFSRVQEPERKQLLMLTVYWSLMRFIKRRGEGKHHPPISLVIDEITALLGDPDAKHELLADDLVELTDRISRSHNIWVTIIHQEMNQISRRVAQTFMRMGTQIIGSSADPDAALQVARRFYPYEPDVVKVSRPVRDRGAIIDWNDEYFSIQEQQELNAQRVLNQKPFCFLIGISERDGQPPASLIPFSIRNIDDGIFKNKEATDKAKEQLMQRDGVPIKDVQDAIEKRLQARQDIPDGAAPQTQRPYRFAGRPQRVEIADEDP